jgi:hypothetical protein
VSRETRQRSFALSPANGPPKLTLRVERGAAQPRSGSPAPTHTRTAQETPCPRRARVRGAAYGRRAGTFLALAVALVVPSRAVADGAVGPVTATWSNGDSIASSGPLETSGDGKLYVYETGPDGVNPATDCIPDIGIEREAPNGNYYPTLRAPLQAVNGEVTSGYSSADMGTEDGGTYRISVDANPWCPVAAGAWTAALYWHPVATSDGQIMVAGFNNVHRDMFFGIGAVVASGIALAFIRLFFGGRG